MQNLIIYKFNPLYHILDEISLDLKFKIFLVNDEKSLNYVIKNLNNYLIISNKEYLNSGKQFIIENFPINIFRPN